MVGGVALGIWCKTQSEDFQTVPSVVAGGGTLPARGRAATVAPHSTRNPIHVPANLGLCAGVLLARAVEYEQVNAHPLFAPPDAPSSD